VLLVFMLVLPACDWGDARESGQPTPPVESPAKPVESGTPTPAPTNATSAGASETPQPTVSVAPTESASLSLIDQLKQQISEMTDTEKIGQLVVVGMEGTTAGPDDLKLIADRKVGGMIFFKPNLTDTTQTVKLLNDLKKMNAGNRIPLWLSVDEEGGRVTRLPAEFAKLPTARSIGRINSLAYSREVGTLLGEGLRSVGFNLDYAPVLDVNSNPNNPVIGDRAFGTEPDVVTRIGIQVMKGLQAAGVASVVKHFPGHGDTSVDSHIGLPVVQHDLDRLRSLELIPFQAAVEQGVDAVMVAHILLPRLDAEHPASFSKAVITGLLREELGYNGVVMTDDMTMGAIAEHYDTGAAAVEAVLAGADIVLVCHDYVKENAVLDALTQAVEDDRISPLRLDESVLRILLMKNKYELSDKPVAVPDVTELNAKVKALLQKYGGIK
jgi:beta-N-acetylhexosaminidase